MESQAGMSCNPVRGKAREQSSEMPSKAAQDSELVLGGREGGRRQFSTGKVPRAERMKVPRGWPL